MALGLTDTPLPLLYNQAGVVIGMSYVLLPYMVLTVYSVMQGIDPAWSARRTAWAREPSPGLPARIPAAFSFPASPAGRCSSSS